MPESQDRPQTRYSVLWEIDDDLSTTPEQAAHEALRLLHGTFAGDASGANVFTVVDSLYGDRRLIDLGLPERSTVEQVWPRFAGEGAPLRRMTLAQALELNTRPPDEAPFLTLLVRVDQERYVAAATFVDRDHHDLLHELALDFGVPHDCSATIVAVEADGALIVKYSTEIVDLEAEDEQ